MTVDDIKQKITPILVQYDIAYAGVFGSVSTGKTNEKSDVDLIIRFGTPMGMFRYMKFVNGLEAALEKKVDVVTDNSLNKHVKPYVLPEIKTIYEK